MAEPLDWQAKALVLHERGTAPRAIARALGVAVFRVEHWLGVGTARLRHAQTMRELHDPDPAEAIARESAARQGVLDDATEFVAGHITRGELLRRIQRGGKRP